MPFFCQFSRGLCGPGRTGAQLLYLSRKSLATYFPKNLIERTYVNSVTVFADGDPAMTKSNPRRKSPRISVSVQNRYSF